MKRLRLMSIVGARPNFMKIAPFIRQLKEHPDKIEHRLVHTGQHYDKAMSDSFWKTLDIPAPDFNLGIGSGTHAEQVGKTMIAIETSIRQWRPDLVVVVGDVNATCAAAITAKKEHLQLAHIEAGLRSSDRTMPEEINRIVTDRLSDLLFTTDKIADANLIAEGCPAPSIHLVGNIMIDTLETFRERAAAIDVREIVSRASAGVTRDLTPLAKGFSVLTLHRPSNVDDPESLRALVGFFITEAIADMPLLWTLHPRTRKHLEQLGLMKAIENAKNLFLLEPLDYLDMLKLNMSAKIMITDSGGLQEECCVLGTPCITLRGNTERPVTLRCNGGTAELSGNDVPTIRRLFSEMKDSPRRESRPPLWDGHTAERIVKVLLAL